LFACLFAVNFLGRLLVLLACFLVCVRATGGPARPMCEYLEYPMRGGPLAPTRPFACLFVCVCCRLFVCLLIFSARLKPSAPPPSTARTTRTNKQTHTNGLNRLNPPERQRTQHNAYAEPLQRDVRHANRRAGPSTRRKRRSKQPNKQTNKHAELAHPGRARSGTLGVPS
jgi:hypothetical protein